MKRKQVSVELAKRLKQARRRVHLTQLEASAALDMARTTIVAIEQAERHVSAEELDRFATLYCVEPDWLLEDSDLPSDLEQKCQRYENFILSMVLSGQMGETGAAEIMEINIIEVRIRMNKRYGEDWRDAEDDDLIRFQKSVNAGDFDDVLETVGWTREYALTKSPELFARNGR